MQEEVYKDIVGFGGDYLVSDLGNIRSNITSKVMKSSSNGFGYLKLQLRVSVGKYVGKYVHRLVAENFIENPNNLPEVNHIDGNKGNNRVDNLEWVTKSDNMKHAIANNLYMPSPLPRFNSYNHPKSKVTEEEVREIVARRKSGEKLIDIAKDFNVGLWQICKIYKRETL